MRPEILVELAQSCRGVPKIAPRCSNGGSQFRCRVTDCIEIPNLIAWDSQHLGDNLNGNPGGVVADQITLRPALEIAEQSVGYLMNTGADPVERPWSERPRHQATQPRVLRWIADQHGRRLDGVEQIRVGLGHDPLDETKR